MDKINNEGILEEVLYLENKKIALLLVNFYKDMTGIKHEMVDSLNLLDCVAKGDRNKKDILRTQVLDNYNDLPRKTLKFIEELLNQFKE